MMNRTFIKISLLVVLFLLACGYGISLFQTISYNRRVLATNIYDYIPHDADYVVNFSRNHHFEEYFVLDSTNSFIINAINENITYPLLIIKKKSEENLLLCRVTKEQEKQIKTIIENQIAPYHLPTKRKEDNRNIYFYSLPQNKFMVALLQDGVLAISLDYLQIEDFIHSDRSIPNILIQENAQSNYFIQKTYESSPISFFINYDSTLYALSYSLIKENINIEGKYFGKQCADSIPISYNKINQLLKLDHHHTDSVIWENDCFLKIKINKTE